MALTAPAVGDELLIFDASADATRNITTANLLTTATPITPTTITASGLVSANLGLTVAGAAFTSRGITDNATAKSVSIESYIASGYYLEIAGSSYAGSYIVAKGSEANARIEIYAKGTGFLQFGGQSGYGVFRVASPASAVAQNGILFNSSSSGNAPYIAASDLGGTGDANIGLRLITVGAGTLSLETNIAGGGTQLQILHTASVTRNITITGSAAGNPTINTTAGSLAITPAVVCASTLTATSINFGQTTLGYYGEGTWTPIDSSGASLSFSQVSGKYSRVGREVFARGTLVYPATADVSSSAIGGLPFTCFNDQESRAGGALTYSSTANARWLIPLANATTNYIYDSTGTRTTNAGLTGAQLYLSSNYPMS